MAQQASAAQLSRLAWLYVRQSTLQHVVAHGESTARQYPLRERAVALGWPDDHIVVIDQDLGHSGASIADRRGFQRLVAEVGLGRVGLVLGLEVSRLARNSSDWRHLLEICALTQTLILDEDGLYDPATFNDRLLLGVKGTMSEAELSMIRARLHGGMVSKARRGMLKLVLPIGLSSTDDDRMVLDPHLQAPVASDDSGGVRRLCADGVCQRHGAPLSPAADPVSASAPEWRPLGRGGVGDPAAPRCPASPASPGLRRGVCLWTDSHRQDGGRQDAQLPGSPRRLAGGTLRCA
jgi:DNA invertase Pin-like site-specific DNA recombinase